MKKIIITIVIVLFSVTATNACEICGCGLGNYYLGMMPQFSHKFFGIRYQVRNFHTVMASDPTQFSYDYYKTIEIWAGWNIGKKWQIIALLPYNYIHQVMDDGIANNQGIGDIAAMVNYKVFDKTSITLKNKSFSQQLWLGLGIKLPTGKFNVDATDPALVALANTQTGSASTDFMLNASYNVRVNKLGLNTSASYKLNTTNKDKYQFGNKITCNSTLFYAAKAGMLGIMPNIGLSYENTASNTLQKITVAQTGGHLLAASAGTEFSIRHFTLGANVQLPVNQNFSSGQTELRVKAMMHITYSL